MRTGRLRNTVTIEEATITEDSFGDDVTVFNKLFNKKADIKILSVDQLLQSGMDLNEEMGTVLTRYDKRVKPEHHLVHKGNRYEIKGLKPDNKHREMIITIYRQVV